MDELGDQDLGVYGESQVCKPAHMDGVGKTLLDDVLHLFNAVERPGVLYTRHVINLEQWQWTYQWGWERVEYLGFGTRRSRVCDRCRVLVGFPTNS